MSQISIIHIVIFYFYCQKRCECKNISQTFERKYLFQINSFTEVSIHSKSGYRSAIECSSMCSLDKECVSFFYDAQSGVCTSHAVQFYPTELGSPDEGFVYYTRPVDRCDCSDILEQNPESPDGVYLINPLDGKGPIRVFCDMTTDGGGWTVFQRRQDGSEDFWRNWNDYKLGFGTLEAEFWLGNDYINRLTLRPVQLRINLGDHENQTRYAAFSSFQIENEANNYRLSVSGYNGTAGDSLNVQNGFEFTTKDCDNDIDAKLNCAVEYTGAWWYRSCHLSNLNGKYGDAQYGKGIVWHYWRGIYYSLKWTEMKLKPI